MRRIITCGKYHIHGFRIIIADSAFSWESSIHSAYTSIHIYFHGQLHFYLKTELTLRAKTCLNDSNSLAVSKIELPIKIYIALLHLFHIWISQSLSPQNFITAKLFTLSKFQFRHWMAYTSMFGMTSVGSLSDTHNPT